MFPHKRSTPTPEQIASDQLIWLAGCYASGSAGRTSDQAVAFAEDVVRRLRPRPGADPADAPAEAVAPAPSPLTARAPEATPRATAKDVLAAVLRMLDVHVAYTRDDDEEYSGWLANLMPALRELRRKTIDLPREILGAESPADLGRRISGRLRT